jgi:pilus assembly protein CpaE
MNVYLLQAGVDLARLEEVEQRLRPALPGLARIESFEDITRRSKTALGARAYILIIAPSTEPEYFSQLVTTIGRYRGNVFFILISGEISATNYKQLVNDGNADWASEVDLPTDVLEIIARVDAKPAPANVAMNRPSVLTFLPSAGGVGNSTLAMETAVLLAKRKAAKEAKVCLIDLDFQSSHVCDYLDIEPKLMVDEIIDAPDRLDSALLDVFVTRHSSGLDVLAPPRGKFRDRDLNVDLELGVEVLSALFDLVAQRYAKIVIDLPLARYPWTLPILAASTGIFVTGRNTIPGLRQMAETVAAIHEQIEVVAKVRPVVNNCEVNLFGRVSRVDHVARVLGREAQPFFVRHAKGAMDCVNAGAPMSIAIPSDRTVKDIRAIVKFCDELRPMGAAATP